MGKYKEWVHKLPEKQEIMEKLTDITDDFVESIKITHPQKYNNFLDKVKQLYDEGHFTEDNLIKAKEITGNDHFTLEDTTKYAKEAYEINFDNESFNEYDFNFIVNEMYSLFHPIYKEEMDKYTELALAWLDHNAGKTFWYFKKLYQ